MKIIILNILFLLFFTNHIIIAHTFHLGNIHNLYSYIDKAAPNDTLYIKNSQINEYGIVIDKPLTIIGDDKTIIDADYHGGNIITITSNNVIIKNIEIKNVKKSAVSDNAAIKLIEVHNCIIENNKITNGFFGIYLAKCENNIIRNNQIESNSIHESMSGNGIHLWQCKHITISNNYISKHRDGIYFEFVTGAKIINNVSHDNLRYGLHFMFSDSCHYTQNTFDHNGAGVAVMYSHNVNMTGNSFINNWGAAAYGVLLKDIRNSIVRNNTFSNNTVGIYTENSTNILLEKNTITKNGWAVKIMANCNGDVFTHNNFISNTFDVATNSSQNNNKFIENYWTAYSGYDLNHDGFGDVPYHPVRLFSLLITQQQPAMILLRSLFIELLDIAERIFPTLTPATLIDEKPLIKPVKL